ncbi:MAG: hypothetical protein COA88_09135 [Kordia sp.]|nr:MAG: hypothetical protein COA88_09135 [Kordia sp.]
MLFTLFKKDMTLFLKDKKAVLLTFILPILLITLFAFAFGGTGKKKSNPRTYTVLVTDLDQSDSSKETIKQLENLKGLTLINKNLQKGKDLVKKGERLALLVFEKGFSEGIKKTHFFKTTLYFDASREIETRMIYSFLMQHLSQNQGKEILKNRVNSFVSNTFSGMPPKMKQNIINTISSENNASPIQIEMQSVMKEKSTKENIGLIQAVVGTAIMMLLFSIANIGGSLLDEKENGTLKRLLYAPFKTTEILFGKMLTALSISIAQLVVMFIFSWLAFGLNIFKDVPALLLMILCTAFAVAGFGIFLVSFVKTRQQLNGFSSLIILTMSAIGGSMIPLFIMPEFMQKMAVVSLNYWGIQGFYDIFWRELSIIEIAPRMLVLLGIGLVMTLISIPLFKKNIISL